MSALRRWRWVARQLGIFSAALAALGAAAWAAEDPPAGVSAGWWSEVQQRITDSEYEVTWQNETGLPDLEASWHAPNRSHDFRTYFTGDGIRVIPRGDDTSAPAWHWELRLLRWGRAGSMPAPEPARVSAVRNEIKYDRGALVESYVNDRRGLEQLFRIEEAPESPDGATLVLLDLALSGSLSPVIAEDGQAIDFRTPQGANVLHYASLRVTDARGTELPSWFEGRSEPGLPRAIRIVYDDAEAVYPVTVDPLTTSAVWSAESNQGSAWFAHSVATAGDVDGDGFSDIVVGAPAYDNGQSDEGRAFVYRGSPSGLDLFPAWNAESNQPSALFGWSVGPAGDVNGDGYADVVIGAYQAPNGGFASVYLGSPGGLAASAAWTAEGNQGGAGYGWSVATAGDVNGDGYADLIVGSPYYTNDQSGEGRAFVYHGSSTGLPASPSWTAESNQTSSQYGSAVGTAGDVNGDGYADVVVGASFYDNGSTNEGRAMLYLGSSTGLAASPVWSAESDQGAASFGVSAGTAGDVNGDGYADVIVGADGYDNGHTNEGRAYVYHGSAAGLSPTAAWITESNQAGGLFGHAVGTAGDINGDGYADVIVGASGYSGVGAALVYLGAAGGLSVSVTWIGPSNQSTAALQGISVATAGDVNGDGYSDVVAGYSQYDNPEANEGRAFLYFGSASGLATTYAWAADSGQPLASYGRAVATGGDINGDGYSDLLVSAIGYDNGEANEGRVFVYHGSATGVSVTATSSVESNWPQAFFGWSVGTAGDVNGDGYSDVVVGSQGYSNGQTSEGRVWLFLGSAAGLTTSAAWTVESDQVSALLGRSVATAGDVNGDGYSEVVVGASGYDLATPHDDQGQVYVYLGSPAGLATTPAWTATPNQDGAQFGDSVATAGDVNRDGYSDLLVGAIGYDNGQDFEGRAFLYLGSAAGLGSSPAWTAESNQPSAWFGHSVATAGDVNGDGYSDVVVGAYQFDNDQLNEGRAFVYLGSPTGLGTTAVWTREGNIVNGNFGHSASTAGDVNGDGYSDVVVGQWGQFDNGQAFVYLGSAAGLATTAAWVVQGDSIADFAMSVASAGDVNGDGFSDVVVGASRNDGRAFLYYGGGGLGLDRIPRQARTDGATPIALLGQSDSDTGFELRTLGRTAAGRGALWLEWEVKPLGVPFDRTGIDTSAVTDTGAPAASGSTASFSEPVTVVGSGMVHRWRLRTASADPYFPRSPWLTLTGNNVTETKLRTASCIDTDGDGHGTGCSLPPDCQDGDSSIWGAPGPTSNMRFTSTTELVWNAPADPGALPSALFYDTLRSDSAGDFLSAVCVESNDGPNTTASASDTPSPDQVHFYLTRAENSCSQGTGSLGTDSSGNPRAGATCP